MLRTLSKPSKRLLGIMSVTDANRYIKLHEDRALRKEGRDSAKYKRYVRMREDLAGDSWIGVWLDGDNWKVMHVATNFGIEHPAEEWTPAYLCKTEAECEKLMKAVSREFKRIEKGDFNDSSEYVSISEIAREDALEDNRNFMKEKGLSFA